MNECEVCGKECKGRTCSGACRAKLSRGARKTVDKAHAQQAHALKRTASLKDYYDNPDDYYPRLEPDKMNWGKWLNMDQLKQAGFKCNRVSIPGNWDYVGCVTQEMIDVSHRPSPEPAQPAPVDEVGQSGTHDPLYAGG